MNWILTPRIFLKTHQRIIRLHKFLRIVFSLKLKFLVSLIEKVNEDIQIKIVSQIQQEEEQRGKKQGGEGMILYGIEQDIVFEAMVAGKPREPHFELLANALLKSTDNCLDLGANHGSHTLVLSKICNKGKVYSFEPQPRVFQALTLNVSLNEITNVQLFNLAVDETTGRNIHIEQVMTTQNRDINSGWSRLLEEYSLQSCLTVALNDLKFPKIGFVKMDIQGSELSAVKGMSRILRNDRPFLFFEVENVHLEFFGVTSRELLFHIIRENYTIFRIQNDYPCDHIAVPSESINQFKKSIWGLGLELVKTEE